MPTNFGHDTADGKPSLSLVEPTPRSKPPEASSARAGATISSERRSWPPLLGSTGCAEHSVDERGQRLVSQSAPVLSVCGHAPSGFVERPLKRRVTLGEERTREGALLYSARLEEQARYFRLVSVWHTDVVFSASLKRIETVARTFLQTGHVPADGWL